MTMIAISTPLRVRRVLVAEAMWDNGVYHSGYETLACSDSKRTCTGGRAPPPSASRKPHWAVQRFGIDLTLLIHTLRLSPAERAAEMHDAIMAAEQVRDAATPGDA